MSLHVRRTLCCKTLLVQLCSVPTVRKETDPRGVFEAMMAEEKKTRTLLHVDGAQASVLTTRHSPTRFLSVRSWE